MCQSNSFVNIWFRILYIKNVPELFFRGIVSPYSFRKEEEEKMAAFNHFNNWIEKIEIRFIVSNLISWFFFIIIKSLAPPPHYWSGLAPHCRKPVPANCCIWDHIKKKIKKILINSKSQVTKIEMWNLCKRPISWYYNWIVAVFLTI